MKRKLFLLLPILMSSFVFSSCQSEPQTSIINRYVEPSNEDENNYLVRGIVKCGNELLSGVSVEYNGKQSTSMENGRFIIRSAYKEGGKITFSKDGYFDYRYKLLKTDFIDGEAVVNVSLTHMIAVSGSIKDTWGNPLSNVVVSCGDISTLSDEYGSYTISNLTSSDHKLTFEKPGYLSTTRIVRQDWYDKNGKLFNINIKLHMTASLRGTVKDQNNQPLRNVKVICGSHVCYTDESGKYLLTDICPEPMNQHQNSGYDVEFYLEGYTYQNASYATYGYGNKGETISRIIHPTVDFYTNPNAVLDVILVKI